MIPMTHDQYLDEPRNTILWKLELKRLENEIEAEEIKKAQNKR